MSNRDPVHPLVGVWSVVLTYEGRPLKEYATSSYHADGTMAMSAGGYSANGAWQPTGPLTAKLYAMAPLGPAEGQSGWHVFEGSIDVSSDGSTFVLRGVRKRPSPSGTALESAATANATRMRAG